MWSFLLSSIRVRVFLVGICSFLVLVSRELSWISWTRIHVFHRGLACSNLIFFSVVLSKLMCIFALGPSSSISNSFVIMLIYSAFFFLLGSLGSHILVQNCSISLSSVWWYVFMSSPRHFLVEFSFDVLVYPLLSILFYPLRILLLLEFFTSASAVVFHRSLSDSMSPQVSRSLLSILAFLNNVVIWMVSTRSPTSKSSSPFSNLLVTVTNAPITFGMIVTFMFHSFFQFPSKVEVQILLSTFFQFHHVVSRNSQFDNFAKSLFCCWLL